LTELGSHTRAHECLLDARTQLKHKPPPPLAAKLCLAEAMTSQDHASAQDLARETLSHTRFCARGDLQAEALLVLSRHSGSHNPEFARAALRAASEAGDSFVELLARLELSRVLYQINAPAAPKVAGAALALKARLSLLQGSAAGTFRARPILRPPPRITDS
jgi:hypothetical protein